MTTRTSGVTVLIAVVLLPSVAASADPAKEADEKGRDCLAKEDFDAATAAFTHAIRLNPKDATAYYGRGGAYRHKGELDKAITDYTEVIRLNPKQAIAYYARAYTYGHKGEPDKAIADFTEAIRLDPIMPVSITTGAISTGERAMPTRR